MALGFGTKNKHTEYNGPKQGRGWWCKRGIAKDQSKRLRPIEDARLAREASTACMVAAPAPTSVSLTET